jgi:hypothetical protein
MRLLIILACAIIVSACNTYQVPKAGSAKLWSSYQVTVPENINQLKQDHVVLWTQDGPLLDNIEFLKPISDGSKLKLNFQPANNSEKAGEFRADMTPEEIIEFLDDSLSLTSLPSHELTNLRPANFGSKTAYMVDWASSTPEGANYQGNILFTVDDNKLWLVLFKAFKTHYFENRKPVFDSVVKSIQF